MPHEMNNDTELKDFPEAPSAERRAEPKPLQEYSEKEWRAHNGDGGRGMSRWKNPLRVQQHVEIAYDVMGRHEVFTQVSGGGTQAASVIERHEVRRRITWQPGETKSIPSIFDSCVRVVHGGIVVGGQAPALQALDYRPVPVLDALREGFEMHLGPDEAP